jgi:hypothetical protein
MRSIITTSVMRSIITTSVMRSIITTGAMRSIVTDLTPASGRQNHTLSPYASAALVSRSFRVHRIPPRVRDDREPPLSSGETDQISR